MKRPLEALPYAKLLELGKKPCMMQGTTCQKSRANWPEVAWCISCQAKAEMERKKIPFCNER